MSVSVVTASYKTTGPPEASNASFYTEQVFLQETKPGKIWRNRSIFGSRYICGLFSSTTGGAWTTSAARDAQRSAGVAGRTVFHSLFRTLMMILSAGFSTKLVPI